ESNDWNEDDLTYNSRNKVGTAVKIITLTQTLGNTADKWLDFDITQAVKAYKAAGKNTISLLLSEDTNVRNPVSNTGSIINFYSKEAGDATAPRLAVEAEENSIEEGGDEGGEDPDLPRLDLFLCIGQSNMAGRGPIDNAKDDRLAIDHCYLFNSNFKFELATNPMNQYSNIRKTLNEQQISPSYGFAKYLSEHQPDITTGMIVNARGGSAMDEWLPGADLYTKTVSRMKKALPYGELKAIIWHQGESNTSSTDTYLAKLNQMVTSMRNEFSAPDAYFLAGELIHSWSPATAFNRMIRTISDVISNSDWVSAEGLTPRSSGDVHFDRQSNISLGERYAQKVIDRLYSNTAIETIENKQVIINESSQLQIFDLCGRKVSSLSKGVFIVYLQTQNSVWKQKIIIN
ncbi:MAG: DNRLRE domain-containing protein, partial [Candidatus Symbiothrix sp.]|nr:DNRLRE domain-containing protein [Candidatus Symbiothrix sp.]